jgi:predicted RNA methylase
LAAGSHGRPEAEIQADIRQFLLDAPLELHEGEVIDVALEAAVAGGRRIDVEAGCAAIEVKKNLRSKTVRSAAIRQLGGYVRQRTEELSERYVGILTDGTTWTLFHLAPDGALHEVNQLEIRGAEDTDRLAAWLENVLSTTEKIDPSPREIIRRLGATSPAAQLDLADLRALYDACRDWPEVEVKRELWARLLLSALGTNFEDSDELFVVHTYLVLTAELVAHEVLGLPVDARNADLRALLEGQQFEMAGLHGVVEADFFDWPVAIAQGWPVIAGIARRLSRFAWEDVEHDVLKELYESLIDADTRRRLGEYYTPDWLAQKMVAENISDPLQQRILDPACGSGTFLFWAVRMLLAACDRAGIDNRQALERAARQIQGMDLHPVAVTLARVTYLLALTRARLRDRDELTVPVFLGDSVRWGHGETAQTESGMTVRTSDPLELVDDTLHFPESVLEQPERFDRLVAALADRAANRKPGPKPPSIAGLLKAHQVEGDADRAAVLTAFKKLCRLHDAGRDHIWSYYIRNLARPLSFTRPEGRVDVLIGNPPWLAYRSMPPDLQRTYRAMATERGLWAGGAVATHQDLSDLFVVRSVEQYLRPAGRFSFVMPFAALSRRQFAGFRAGSWNSEVRTLNVAFQAPEEFARVKPPLFQVPACVVSGSRSRRPLALPAAGMRWTGRLPSHHLDWTSAAEYLDSVGVDTPEAPTEAASVYRAAFRQGASLVPRMLITVAERPGGPLGVTAGRVAVRSARSPNEKAPWKMLPSLTGVVEQQFVLPVHLGATIVAYRARQPRLAVVPWLDGRLLCGSSERLDEFRGLASWWRQAEEVWEENRSKASRLGLVDQIDFQSKLSKQFPIAGQRVVYTKSGQHLAACRIVDNHALIDHKLYWAALGSADEARFVCAMLNSEVVAITAAELQARGQHNPRDFDTHIFAVALPKYEPRDKKHQELAELAARAESVSAMVDLDEDWQFQKARRIVREALREDGVSTEIDVLVDELVRGGAGDVAAAPDLIAALSRSRERRQAGTARAKRTADATPPAPNKSALPRD